MAKKRRISDGACAEEVHALLLRCIHRLRALTPPGANLNDLDRMEAEIAWEASFDAWIAANPKPRYAIVCGSDQSH
jgi:hypothetical protein